MSAQPSSLVESGLAYCTAHHGVIDCDESVCDFIDDALYPCPSCAGKGGWRNDADEFVDCAACDGDGVTPCVSAPLVYDPEAAR